MEDKKLGLKFFGQGCLLVLVILLVLFVLQCLDLTWFKFWAPKYENVKRETFVNTQSYTEGMAQQLRDYQLDYVKATASQKESIRQIILHQYANYDESKLPTDLQSFLHEIKAEEKL